MANHVLLIEDDARIRDVVERSLGARGFAVTSAPDAPTGIELGRDLDVDLVLLDLVLPGGDGLTVLESLRRTKPRLPVIAVTALADLRCKLDGLEAGADDYVTKPFSIDELVARIRARLRWADDDETTLQSGPVTLDLAAHRAVVDGRSIALSAREVSLLATFLHHPGQVLSREQLLRLVWDLNFDPGSNVVDVYVAALRRKLGNGFIETVRGLGYRFVAVEDRAEELTA
jgi:DNA-binding response OmpR family regulator